MASTGIVSWEHCCDRQRLRGYLTVIVSGQVVIYCDACGTSRCVRTASLRRMKRKTKPN